MARAADARGRRQRIDFALSSSSLTRPGWHALVLILRTLFDAIHHRGQLSTYFRAMGAKVPSIYGESYDDAQARKAAQAGAA